MKHLSRRGHLAASGFGASALMLLAGVIATLGGHGIAVASLLLTIAAIIAADGVAAFRGHAWDRGIWVLLSAALPLFGLLYAIGWTILQQAGRALAGGLLLALAAAVAAATGFGTVRMHEHAPD